MRQTSAALLILIATFAFGGVNTWTTSGPDGVQVWNIIADPSNPDTLFVLTPAGIYRSTDGAATWVSANEGLKSTEINTFAVAGGDVTTLYAAIGREIWASTDRGDHWSRRGALDYSVYSLAYSRSQRTLFAIPSGQSDLFSSVDGGTTWQLVVIRPFLTINTLQTSQTAVFAQLGGGTAFRSIDGGLTWTAVTMPSSIALFATEDSRAVFGVALPKVFVSEDDGETWTQLPDAPTDQLLSIRMSGSAIYAATIDGVLGYDSAKKAWSLIGPEQPAFSLAVTSTSPLRMYATGASGVIAYNDEGFVIANRGLPHSAARSVALSGKDTWVAYGSTNQAIYRTDDAGNSWRSVAGTGAADLAVSPASDVVYAAMQDGVRRSADGGKTWSGVSPASRFSLTRVAVAHSDPATVYAVVSDGLFKSTDSGNSWLSISHDLSFDYYDYYGFTTTAMAVDPANADNVAIAKFSGVFVTSDGGKTWQHPLGDSNLPALGFDPTSLYAARADIGIQKSSDFGRSWSDAGLINKRVSALATSGRTLFAGTADGRIYRSDDGGAFWDAFEDGLSRGSIRELAVDASGQRLYAATAAGFYEFDLGRHVLGARPFASSRSIDDYLNGPSLVIPVAGKAIAGDGTVFTTDVMLSAADVPQGVVLAWLPLGSGSPSFFQAELRAGETRVIDVNEELGVTGIGSLAVFGVDATGSARIWSHPVDGRAPFSQSIDAAGGGLLQAHGHAAIDGIRVDAHKRVNVGIVNLSPQAHQFTVGDMALTVAPFSLEQVPLPAANGAIEAFADDSRVRWILYASQIDRTTGDIRTVIGQIQ